MGIQNARACVTVALTRSLLERKLWRLATVVETVAETLAEFW